MEVKTFVVGPLLTNCYLIFSKDEAVFIDPGAFTKEMLKEIEDKKLLYIILTHYHWDHILGAKKLKEKTGAKILIHKKDKKFLKFEVDQLLDGGEEIRINDNFLRIIHTPGHTSGSISILIDNFLFVGDTVFEEGFGRTDLPGGCEEDLKNSLKILKKIFKPGIKILPGHGPSFETLHF